MSAPTSDPRVIDEGHGFYRVRGDQPGGDFVVQPRPGARSVGFFEHELSPRQWWADSADEVLAQFFAEAPQPILEGS